jgi:transposase
MIPNSAQIRHTVAKRRDDICLYLSRSDRGSRPSSTTARLATADGHGTNEIMRRTGMSKTTVWCWQERYIEDGIEGLLRDKTRPSRIPPLSDAVKLAVLTKTASGEPADATHWSRASMAEAIGISPSSVERASDASGRRPA